MSRSFPAIRLSICCLLAFCAAGPLAAQSLLRGRITDPDGTPVSFAHVHAEGRREGVLSQENGEYTLELPAGNWRMVFERLGFERQLIAVSVRGDQQLDVVLVPNTDSIATVQITAGKRDPAYAIMEKVIASKQDNLRDLLSFTRESYQYLRLERDTTLRRPKRSPKTQTAADSLPADSLSAPPIVSDSLPPPGPQLWALIESQATCHYQAPNLYKSIYHAYKRHSAEVKPRTESNFIDESAYEIESDNPFIYQPDPGENRLELYRNLVQAPTLSDVPLISPLHSELWRLTYTYRLEERLFEDGKVVFKIAVTPRNREGAVFEGHLYIVNDLWAIKAAELRIMPGSLNFFSEFSFRLQYTRSPLGRWLLSEESYSYAAREGRDRYTGLSRALHTDYQPDVVHPKRLFGNELLSVSATAFERDSAYWARLRPAPLGQEERLFVRARDSINARLNSPEYLAEQDSAYNRISLLDIAFNGIGFRDRRRMMEYFFNPVVSQFRPLGVGGYRHAIGGNIEKTFRNYKAIGIGGEADYGFNNRDLRGNLSIGFTYNPKRFSRASIRAGDDYTLVTFNETITAFLSRNNFVRKQYLSLDHRFELVNGLYLYTQAEFADRKPINPEQLEDWSQVIFGELNAPREFDPYRELRLTISLSWTPFQKYRMLPFRKVVIGSKWPTFELLYRKALPGFFGSEINFDFLRLRISHEYRPGPWGIGRWNLTAGTFLQAQSLRFNDYTFFRGSDPGLFVDPLNNFQLLRRTLSTPGEYLRGHYIHDFGRMFFNKVPLIRRTALSASAGAGFLYVRESNFLHTEVFAGLQYPFRIRRQRMKVGIFAVAAYGDYPDALSGQIKAGMSFYNPVKRRWSY